ncbi:MAG: CvpA family protein [Planctomycetota bacterium]
MQIYDIVMLAVLVAATVFGGIKGFAWQLASITSIVGSYFVAYRFRDTLAARIDADPPWDRFLAMLILFVACSLTVWVIFRMFTGAIDRLKLHEFDHHVGAVFGLLKGGLYCILATLFAVTLCGESVRESVLASRSGTTITQWLSKSESVVPPEVLAFVQPYLDRVPDPNALPGLPPESLPAASDLRPPMIAEGNRQKRR